MTKQLTLPIALPGVFTVTHWMPPEIELRDDHWIEVFESLFQIGKANNWHKGDILNYGSERYGEKYAQAVDLWMLSYGSLANIASVCQRIPAGRRRPNLSFSHHQEVAYLDEGVADTILSAADCFEFKVVDVRAIKNRYLNTDLDQSDLGVEISRQVAYMTERALTQPPAPPEPVISPPAGNGTDTEQQHGLLVDVGTGEVLADPGEDDPTLQREGEDVEGWAFRVRAWGWSWRNRAVRLERENDELKNTVEELKTRLDPLRAFVPAAPPLAVGNPNDRLSS